MNEKPLRTKTLRALQIIRDHRITSPSMFGRLMWPDNPNWTHNGKAGPNGQAKGVGMRLASGAFLGKLAKAGLIHNGSSVYLTARGHAALGAIETASP